MVIYSLKSIDDLTAILFGLRNWTKHIISNEHALNYVDDISSPLVNMIKSNGIEISIA